MIVIRTTLVNGSICSSHTRSSSSSAETTPPCARHQRLEHAELLAGQRDLLAAAGQPPAARVELDVIVA